jgi:hypothetical protein
METNGRRKRLTIIVGKIPNGRLENTEYSTNNQRKPCDQQDYQRWMSFDFPSSFPSKDSRENGEQQQEIACQEHALPTRPSDLRNIETSVELRRLRMGKIGSCEVGPAEDDSGVGQD